MASEAASGWQDPYASGWGAQAEGEQRMRYGPTPINPGGPPQVDSTPGREGWHAADLLYGLLIRQSCGTVERRPGRHRRGQCRKWQCFWNGDVEKV